MPRPRLDHVRKAQILSAAAEVLHRWIGRSAAWAESVRGEPYESAVARLIPAIEVVSFLTRGAWCNG